MDCRPLEITLFSASDIKDVNLFSKMDVYAVVSVAGGGRKQRLRTPVCKDGGTNPKWNHPLKLTLEEAPLSQNRLRLKIKLVSDRVLGATKIGKAVVPVKELLDNADEKREKNVTYAVLTPKGKPKGTVTFGYRFGEKFSAPAPAFPEPYKKSQAHQAQHEPVMAYPAGHAGPSTAYQQTGAPGVAAYPYPPQNPGYGYPPQTSGYGYPPQPQQSGYGYPPPQQAGYGYPPQQAGYGYPPAVKPQKPKRGGMGLGLGAGLLGGLLIGDMVSDVGDMGGCGDGFDGGFDF